MFPDRISRVESMLQEEIARILEGRREEIERHAGAGLLTLTSVRVERNLETAVVGYSWTEPCEGGTGDKLQHTLEEIGFEISRELAKRVKIKRLPKISFFYDSSLAKAERVYRILNKLSQQ